MQRNGQQTFRRRLIKAVGYCEATLCTQSFALEACHIKPYNLCNDNEKYDVNNSLCLLSSIHKLFDKGFISFNNEDGKIIISNQFPIDDLVYFGLNGNERIRLNGKRPEYLKFHKENIFRP